VSLHIQRGPSQLLQIFPGFIKEAPLLQVEYQLERDLFIDVGMDINPIEISTWIHLFGTLWQLNMV
jgi:hypothetical protein